MNLKRCNGGILILGMLLLAIAPAGVVGQDKYDRVKQSAIGAETINDNFLPPLQDYYFTNGLHIYYGRLVNDHFLFGGLFPMEDRKSILRFKVGHEIYTPRLVVARNVELLDRPYAGYLFLKSSVDSYWRERSRFKLDMTLGVIGPAAGGEWLQTQWHEWFNFPQPQGWQFQLSNIPVINAGLEYQREWLLLPKIDFISKTKARFGTAFNDLSTGATIRVGNFNSIDCSAINNSRIGEPGRTRAKPGSSHTEWFFFLGLNNSLVLHNALIEGRFLTSGESVHTEKAEAYLLTLTGGVSFSLPAVGWTLVMNQLTPEVVGGRPHNYVSLRMNVRF